MEQKIVKIGSAELAAKLYGAFDANMKLVEAEYTFDYSDGWFRFVAEVPTE